MNTRRGFSLLEVVVAMGVLSIAILGILATMLANIRVAETTRQNDIASNAAKSMMDRIRATPFAAIGPTFGDPNNTFFVPDLPRRPNGAPHGIVHFSLAPPADPAPFSGTPPPGNLVNVRVRVFWSRIEVPAGGPQTLTENEHVVTYQTVIYTDTP